MVDNITKRLCILQNLWYNNYCSFMKVVRDIFGLFQSDFFIHFPADLFGILFFDKAHQSSQRRTFSFLSPVLCLGRAEVYPFNGCHNGSGFFCGAFYRKIQRNEKSEAVFNLGGGFDAFVARRV